MRLLDVFMLAGVGATVGSLSAVVAARALLLRRFTAPILGGVIAAGVVCGVLGAAGETVTTTMLSEDPTTSSQPGIRDVAEPPVPLTAMLGAACGGLGAGALGARVLAPEARLESGRRAGLGPATLLWSPGFRHGMLFGLVLLGITLLASGYLVHGCYLIVAALLVAAVSSYLAAG